MALVSLKMDKKEMADDASPLADRSPYPYGVCLNLETEELKKLGIDASNLPSVGDEFHIHAIGKVTRVSENESEAKDGYSCGVGVQITAMEMSNEGPEDGDSVAEEEAEDAESSAVGGRTVLANAYRGRK